MPLLEARTASEALRPFLSIESTLFSPHLEAGHKLHRLLNTSLGSLTVSSPEAPKESPFWGAERYGLHRSTIFNALAPEAQRRVLQRLSDANIGLSYFIESSGLNYGAKMILLSESLEEKTAYALFTAEEAVHRCEFTHFMRPETELTPLSEHPMLQPLAVAIEKASRETLTFTIQVLLEGFGMAHYHALGAQCREPSLQEVFKRILQDEARHHGTGIILFEGARPTLAVRDEIFEYSRSFIHALQGAFWVAEAVETDLGPLSARQRQRFFEEIELESQLARRLARLREMIERVDGFGLVERLDRERAFVPLVNPVFADAKTARP